MTPEQAVDVVTVLHSIKDTLLFIQMAMFFMAGFYVMGAWFSRSK